MAALDSVVKRLPPLTRTTRMSSAPIIQTYHHSLSSFSLCLLGSPWDGKKQWDEHLVASHLAVFGVEMLGLFGCCQESLEISPLCCPVEGGLRLLGSASHSAYTRL